MLCKHRHWQLTLNFRGRIGTTPSDNLSWPIGVIQCSLLLHFSNCMNLGSSLVQGFSFTFFFFFITSVKTSLLLKKKASFVFESVRLMVRVKRFMSKKEATIFCEPFHLGTSVAGCQEGGSSSPSETSSSASLQSMPEGQAPAKGVCMPRSNLTCSLISNRMVPNTVQLLLMLCSKLKGENFHVFLPRLRSFPVFKNE